MVRQVKRIRKKQGAGKAGRSFLYHSIFCKRLASTGRLGHGDWVRPMNIATAAAVIPNSRTAQKYVKLLA